MVAGVQTFDRVCRTNHFPYFHVVIEEGNEFFPRVLPQPDDRGIPGAPFFFQRLKGIPSSIRAGSRIDGLEITFEFVPVFLRREPKRSPDQMDDAGLNCRHGPHVAHNFWQAFGVRHKLKRTRLWCLYGECQ